MPSFIFWKRIEKKKLNDRDREGRHVLVGLGFHILFLSIPNPLLRLQCCASRIPTPIARTAGRHGEPHVAGVAAGLLRLHRPHAPPRRRRPLPLHQEVRRFAPLAPLPSPHMASILTWDSTAASSRPSPRPASPTPRSTAAGSRPSSRRWRPPSGTTRFGPMPPIRKSTTRSRWPRPNPCAWFAFWNPHQCVAFNWTSCVSLVRGLRSISWPNCSIEPSLHLRRMRNPTSRFQRRLVSCSTSSGLITWTYPSFCTMRQRGW